MAQTKKQQEEVKQAMKESPPVDKKVIFLILQDVLVMKVMYLKN
jgi:hypothetical protein